MTFVSFPPLLDRDVDFVDSHEYERLRRNPLAVVAWAIAIAGLLIPESLPFFLGLGIVLPNQRHAAWHLYARSLIQRQRDTTTWAVAASDNHLVGTRPLPDTKDATPWLLRRMLGARGRFNGSLRRKRHENWVCRRAV